MTGSAAMDRAPATLWPDLTTVEHRVVNKLVGR